ncbi:unnamed protein product [Trifolium pratense]|uniref:Uncharacterized protein n=1 Tax=Trifolium pratense TaxID=57577 RepID=A0ACB0K6F7_TRIPR|nr:unnamed protein product [Trifolium pratense]
MIRSIKRSIGVEYIIRCLLLFLGARGGEGVTDERDDGDEIGVRGDSMKMESGSGDEIGVRGDSMKTKQQQEE